MPTTIIESSNITLVDAIIKIGFAPSKGQAKMLITQGGISINDNKVEDISYTLSEKDFGNNCAIIKKGKKMFNKLIIK